MGISLKMTKEELTDLCIGALTHDIGKTFIPKEIAFGDYQYYWIADREGRSFKRLSELFAVTGQIGFVATQRVDGKLILPEAVKILKQK